ncbi:MAG TPA: DUF4115 domain-containing protein [Alphaproteobacteria bacterium]|nr:DUF4115 domain-containing protein [Alphaproteobacteria bacterium]
MMDGAGTTESHRTPNGGLAEVGAMLRDRRKELGHDIQSVARQTHIKVSYLSAIEEGRRRDLPGAAYTIGFVRTYADFLGFDGNRLVTDFHAQLAGARLRPAAQAAQAAQEAPRVTVSPVLVAGAVLALALVGFFLWGYLSDNSNDTNSATVEEAQDAPDGDGSAADETASDAQALDAGDSAAAQDGTAAPAANNGADASAAAAAGATDQAAPAAAADATPPSDQSGAAPAGTEQTGADTTGLEDQLPPQEGEPGDTANQDPEQVQQASAAEGAPTGKVVLRARLESWVQVTNEKGESVFSRVLRAGETYTVPNETGLMLTTGNAGGIEIVLDGKKLKSLGSVGLVRRDFPLDAKKLKDGSAYKAAPVSQTTQ